MWYSVRSSTRPTFKWLANLDGKTGQWSQGCYTRYSSEGEAQFIADQLNALGYPSTTFQTQ